MTALTITWQNFKTKIPEHDAEIVYMCPQFNMGFEYFEPKYANVEYSWMSIDDDCGDSICWNDGDVAVWDKPVNGYQLVIMLDGYVIQPYWLWMGAGEYDDLLHDYHDQFKTVDADDPS